MARVLRRDADGNVYQVQTNDQGEVVTKGGQEVRLADGVSTQEFKPSVHDGWYFEFPSAGEAVLSSPVRRLNFILFTTVRPKSGTERELSCSLDPQGTLYAFSPVTGLPIRNLLSTTSLLIFWLGQQHQKTDQHQFVQPADSMARNHGSAHPQRDQGDRGRGPGCGR